MNGQAKAGEEFARICLRGYIYEEMMTEQTQDYLVRIWAKEAGLRALACVTTGLANEAARRHAAQPPAAALLAQGLTGAALLGALLKVQQRIALKFEGNGPLQKILAESDSYGRVRGYVAQPEAVMPAGSQGTYGVDSLGTQITLTVVKDVQLANLQQSVVDMSGHSIDGGLTYYLHQSEQTASVVEIDEGLNADDDADHRLDVSGGLLVQSLPDHEEGVLEQVADRLDGLPPMAQLLRDGKSVEEILAAIFVDFEYETLEVRPLEFHCSCSWERSEKALLMLGRDDLETLIDEGQAVVDCHFCHERYIFGREALEMILEAHG